MHALLLVLPEGEVERDGQLEQEAEPEALLYLPAVQLVHGPPAGPLEPASQSYTEREREEKGGGGGGGYHGNTLMFKKSKKNIEE